MRQPTIKAVATELRHINKQTFETYEEDGIEIRIQLYPAGDWYLHVGDPSYDTDHQGFWGATTIPGNNKRFSSIETARDLINQTQAFPNHAEVEGPQ